MHQLNTKSLSTVAATLALLVPLTWVEVAWAVDCIDTNYRLHSQSAVDALGATGCSHVSGDVEITSYSTDDPISNLDSLSNLTSIGGQLTISYTSIVDLDGLHNLATFGWRLVVEENEYLTNIDALSNVTLLDSDVNIAIVSNAQLTNINGLAGVSAVSGLNIHDNPKLNNIDGLQNLSTVGGVFISNNATLANLDGLAGIRGAVGEIGIKNNTALSDIDGLANISAVSILSIEGTNGLTDLNALSNLTQFDSLHIENNHSLLNLDGLAKLTYTYVLEIVGNPVLNDLSGLASIRSSQSAGNTTQMYRLVVQDNASLSDLDVFEGITELSGDLRVIRNESLTNLDGLSNLESVGGMLIIGHNPTLGNCQGVAGLLGEPTGPPSDFVTGEIIIEENAVGCNSLKEIIPAYVPPTPTTVLRECSNVTSGVAELMFEDRLNGEYNDFWGFLYSDCAIEFIPVGTTDVDGGFMHMAMGMRSGPGIDAGTFLSLAGFPNSKLTPPPTSNKVGTYTATDPPLGQVHSMPANYLGADYSGDCTEAPLYPPGITLSPTDGAIYCGWFDFDGGKRVLVRGRLRNPSGAYRDLYWEDPLMLIEYPRREPTSPNIVAIDAENEVISLAVSTDDYGSPITRYDATCTDGTNTFTGQSTSSPIMVSGLTNDVAYTCKVTATNSVGTSSASAATDPIIPEEIYTGLPIWLLYEATQ